MRSPQALQCCYLRNAYDDFRLVVSLNLLAVLRIILSTACPPPLPRTVISCPIKDRAEYKERRLEKIDSQTRYLHIGSLLPKGADLFNLEQMSS